MRRKGFQVLAVVLAAFSIGCASTKKSAPAAAERNAPQANSNGPGDPWEGFNRKMFWFNEKVDIHFLRPVAVGWDFVMPDIVQTGIRNVFTNVRFPITFANDLLQAKPLEASKELGRFVLNSTLGLGGMLDPATAIGLETNNEDFGQTLGYWGVPSGPYLVMPLLGPSNPRDLAGFAADSASQPYTYFLAWYVNLALGTVNVVNTRARYIEEIDENRRTALDFYSFQRNAYVNFRENLVNDRAESADAETDGLYYFEDEDDDVGGP